MGGSTVIACGVQVLQVKQRTRLFSKTTCSYSCVTSWQYSFYNTIARLIHIVFKFAIVSCTCMYSSRYSYIS